MPVLNDRFLRSLLLLTPGHHDLVAGFLTRFGLDPAPPSVQDDTADLVVQCDQLGRVCGTEQEAPRHLWLKHEERLQAKLRHSAAMRRQLGLNLVDPATHVIAQYCSIPRIAGLLPPMRADDAPLDVKNSLLHVFVSAGNAKLFGSQLMLKVLQFKWETYARHLFLKELFLFVLLLALFVAFTILLVDIPRDLSLSTILEDHRRATIEIIILASIIPLFSLRTLYREFQQLKETPGNVLQKLLQHMGDGWSILQVTSAVMSIVSCASFFNRASNVRPVAAVTALLLWLQTLYFLRAFSFSGALVRMIFKVLFLSIPYLCVLTIVLLGVTNCFFVLFADLSEQGPDWVSFTPGDRFYDTFFGVYHTMLLSEVEQFLGQLGDTRDVVLVKFLFVLFTVLVSIFMLNLMINLMQDFMDRINQAEGDAFPFEKARIIAELELSMPRHQLRDPALFPKWLHVLTPKNVFVVSRTGLRCTQHCYASTPSDLAFMFLHSRLPTVFLGTGRDKRRLSKPPTPGWGIGSSNGSKDFPKRLMALWRRWTRKSTTRLKHCERQFTILARKQTCGERLTRSNRLCASRL
eukprot:m.224040 g.224040  ORF g.224040 m.224040 type:complete len:577 (+) comp18764_c0_seq9:185-1915(+)